MNGTQIEFDFDRLPMEAEPEVDPEPEIERPTGRAGEFWNGRIFVSDDDLPF